MGTFEPFTLQHKVKPPEVFSLRRKIWQAIAYASSYGYDPRRWRIAHSPRVLMCDAIEMREVMDDSRHRTPTKYADHNKLIIDELMLGVERGHSTVFPTTIRTAAGIGDNAGTTFLRLYVETDCYLNARLKQEQLYIQETVAPYIGCAAADVCLSSPYATLAAISSAETEQHELDVITDEAERLGIHRTPFAVRSLERPRVGKGQSNFGPWLGCYFAEEKNLFHSQHMLAYAANLGLMEMGILPNEPRPIRFANDYRQ
ncbi:MAG TPA: hypothetical protein VLE73_03770 [Candidatus Saccharimonadales bacterium]|nr:hypothetical protein [Candidatus Saccharimonadales bacterium]